MFEMSNLYFVKKELLVNTANFAVEPTFLKGPRSIISEGLVPGPLYIVCRSQHISKMEDITLFIIQK